MEEVTRSHMAASDTEKGVQTPPDETNYGTHLSNIHDDTPLPPMDGGMDAWLFLAACFAMEALVWGFAFTYGVFQAYYSDIPQFKDSGNIAVVGTCAMGIMYLDIPLVFAAYRQWPRYQRLGCGLGVLMMCAALGLSSLATNTNHLIISQGIFYAIGGSIAYAPCILLMEEWFDRRKGLAFGVMWAGTGLGGAVLPIVIEQLLGKYGFRITLRGFAVVLFVLTGPLVYFVKPRVPIPASRPSPPAPSFRFLFTSTFALFQVCNTIEALGFFLPSLYLPTYAGMLGASTSLQALTVILFNSASVAGCVIMGAIIDKFDVTICILVNTIASTLAVFLIWGFSMSLAPLYVFSIIYGLSAGSYTSTWPGIMREVVNKKPSAESSMVFASLAAGRGIGNLVSGPLSEALVKGMPWEGNVGWGYGSGYGTLIVFTGVTGVVGGGSYLARSMKWL
ncbi:Major facilitator superfamily domain general substrate transporter [Penicillium robsamsonii]|uniref:Major facilitator superfamily domain general substrate transporter n=1 Tax=Penicillium robsamsonii TaxID=1792511 RepID=UPI002547C75D|nr:Major facilitator superfamily domain general substrate transporter [Penicillium robsamsonii]KAJ5817863.1 Major facilitator superfamily domain general substrate transporter [Penicillium robsamsonii]